MYVKRSHHDTVISTIAIYLKKMNHRISLPKYCYVLYSTEYGTCSREGGKTRAPTWRPHVRYPRANKSMEFVFSKNSIYYFLIINNKGEKNPDVKIYTAGNWITTSKSAGFSVSRDEAGRSIAACRCIKAFVRLISSSGSRSRRRISCGGKQVVELSMPMQS